MQTNTSCLQHVSVDPVKHKRRFHKGSRGSHTLAARSPGSAVPAPISTTLTPLNSRLLAQMRYASNTPEGQVKRPKSSDKT